MRERPRRGCLGLVLMGLAAVLAALGQLLWKLSANGGWAELCGGLVLYAVGALLMLVAYRHGPLSVLQPVLSLGYVLSLLLGWWVLGERVTAWRWLGVAVIVAGVALLASAERDGLTPTAEDGEDRCA